MTSSRPRQKMKTSSPASCPLWLNAGSGSGANGLLQGVNNFIVGSSTPTIHDGKTNKCVVDSPGIRASLGPVHAGRVRAGPRAPRDLGAVQPQCGDNAADGCSRPGQARHGGRVELLRRQLDEVHQRPVSGPGRAEDRWPSGDHPDLGRRRVASTLGGWDYAIAAHTKLRRRRSTSSTSPRTSRTASTPPTGPVGAAGPGLLEPRPRFTEFAPPYNVVLREDHGPRRP